MTTMMRKIEPEEANKICRFFADYATTMLGCGATCIRITKNVNRMAAALGVMADMVILPAHITVTVANPEDGEVVCFLTKKTVEMPISFSLNTALSKLSWRLYEKRVSFDEAMEEFGREKSIKPINKWLVLLLVVFANASFCWIFGGDSIAMAIVAFATLVGYYLKMEMLANKADVRVVFIVSSFVSAVIGTAGYVFALSSTPDVALGTSVLYLIPGIPYINSVSDMLDGHYICSFCRFAHAFILTACISLGLTAGFLLMNIRIF